MRSRRCRRGPAEAREGSPRHLPPFDARRARREAPDPPAAADPTGTLDEPAGAAAAPSQPEPVGVADCRLCTGDGGPPRSRNAEPRQPPASAAFRSGDRWGPGHLLESRDARQTPTRRGRGAGTRRGSSTEGPFGHGRRRRGAALVSCGGRTASATFPSAERPPVPTGVVGWQGSASTGSDARAAWRRGLGVRDDASEARSGQPGDSSRRVLGDGRRTPLAGQRAPEGGRPAVGGRGWSRCRTASSNAPG